MYVMNSDTIRQSDLIHMAMFPDEKKDAEGF